MGNGKLRPQVSKVEAILRSPMSRTKKEVRSFLGLVGWYRRFIPDFATIAAPLKDLYRKQGKTQWSGQRPVRVHSTPWRTRCVPEHVSGAERWEFPLPAHVGVRSPRSTAQSRTRSLRSIPLPAHLQFHPAPVKSLHARSNLKFLCIPNTCRFQPKPYAWDTLSAWQTWSGFVAWLLRKKSASLLFYRGAAVAAWLDHTWYARIPQAMWLL